MKHLVVLPFLAMLFLAVPARTETVTGLERFALWPSSERFALWNDCRPIRLVVQDLGDDAADIGLKWEAISVAVRSRLRAARLYTAEMGWPPQSQLYINVNIVGAAFDITVEYNKWLTDSISGEQGFAATWSKGSTGTHGRNSGFVLSAVSRHTDSFIDEYLRVNEDACKR